MAMMTVYSEKHLLRNPRTELYGGELITPDECAQRAEFVLDRVKATGLGEGTGFNLNVPLPRGTDYRVWRAPLGTALNRIAKFAPGALVVSLGINAVNVLQGFG
jgi:hypothetical protein